MRFLAEYEIRQKPFWRTVFGTSELLDFYGNDKSINRVKADLDFLVSTFVVLVAH